jgi:hypothetical protein
VGGRSEGKFEDLGNGKYRFTPADNYFGTINLAYSYAGINPTLDLTILPVNDAPVVKSIEGAKNTFVENEAPVALFRNVVLSVVEAGQKFEAFTLRTKDFVDGDTLIIEGVTYTFHDLTDRDHGVHEITISGEWTAGELAVVLEAAAYEHTGAAPSGTREVYVSSLKDDGGRVGLGFDTLALLESAAFVDAEINREAQPYAFDLVAEGYHAVIETVATQSVPSVTASTPLMRLVEDQPVSLSTLGLALTATAADAVDNYKNYSLTLGVNTNKVRLAFDFSNQADLSRNGNELLWKSKRFGTYVEDANQIKFVFDSKHTVATSSIVHALINSATLEYYVQNDTYFDPTVYEFILPITVTSEVGSTRVNIATQLESVVDPMSWISTKGQTHVVSPGHTPLPLFSDVDLSALESHQYFSEVTLEVTGIKGTEFLKFGGHIAPLTDRTIYLTAKAEQPIIKYQVIRSDAIATVKFSVRDPETYSGDGIIDFLNDLSYIINGDTSVGLRTIEIVDVKETTKQNVIGAIIGTKSAIPPVNLSIASVTLEELNTAQYVEDGAASKAFADVTFDKSIPLPEDLKDFKLILSRAGFSSNPKETYAIDTSGNRLLLNEDKLSLDDRVVANIAMPAGSLSLTFLEDLSVAEVESIMDAILYSSTEQDPSTTQRLKYSIFTPKGDEYLSGSVILNITSVNDAPSLTATAGKFVQKQPNDETKLFSNVTATPIEGAQSIKSFQLSVEGVAGNGTDYLRLSNNSILIDETTEPKTIYSNVVEITEDNVNAKYIVDVSFNEDLNVSQFERLIEGIAYKSSATNSDPSLHNERVITLTRVGDDGGTANGGINYNDLNIESRVSFPEINNKPTLSATPTDPTFLEAGAPVALYSGITSSNADAGSDQLLTKVIIELTGILDGQSEILYLGDEPLEITEIGSTFSGVAYSIAESANTQQLTLTGNWEASQLDALLESLKYQNISSKPTDGIREISIKQIFDDGGNLYGSSDNSEYTTLLSKIVVQSVDKAPTLNITTNDITYITGLGTVRLFSNAKLSTVEDDQLFTSIQLTVTNINPQGNEFLRLGDQTVDLTTSATNSLTVSIEGEDNPYSVNANVVVLARTALVTIESNGTNITDDVATQLINNLGYENSDVLTDESSRSLRVSKLVDNGTSPGNNTSNFDEAIYATTINIPSTNFPPSVTTPSSLHRVEPAGTLNINGISLADLNDTLIDLVIKVETDELGPLGSLSLNSTLAGGINDSNIDISVAGQITLNTVSISDLNAILAKGGLSFTARDGFDSLSGDFVDLTVTATDDEGLYDSDLVRIAVVPDPTIVTLEDVAQSHDLPGGAGSYVFGVYAGGEFTAKALEDGKLKTSLGEISGRSGDLTACNGKILFTPFDNASGTTTFAYQVDSGAVVVVDLVVAAVNDAPVVKGSDLKSLWLTDTTTSITAFPDVVIANVESDQTVKSMIIQTFGVQDGEKEILRVGADDLKLKKGSGTIGNITYSQSVLNGVATLTLNGNWSMTEAQDILHSIKYYNTDAQTVGSRIITLSKLIDNGGNALGGSDQSSKSLSHSIKFAAEFETSLQNVSDQASSTTIIENDVPTILSRTVVVSDNKMDWQNNYDSATVRVERKTGGLPEDRFSFDLSNTTYSLSDMAIFDATTKIATIDNTLGYLSVRFIGATSQQVDDLLQSISYENLSDTPTGGGSGPTGTRLDFNWVFTGSDSDSELGYVNFVDVNDAAIFLTTAHNSQIVEKNINRDTSTRSTGPIFSNTSIDLIETNQTISEISLEIRNTSKVLSELQNEFVSFAGTAIALTDEATKTVAVENVTADVANTNGTAIVSFSFGDNWTVSDVETFIDSIKYENNNEKLLNGQTRNFKISSIKEADTSRLFLTPIDSDVATVEFITDRLTYFEDQQPIKIFPAIDFKEKISGANIAGGTLVIKRDGGSNPIDYLHGAAQTNMSNSRLNEEASGDWVVNGRTLGEIKFSSGELTLTPNVDASADDLEAFLRQITYQVVNSEPDPDLKVQINWTWNNGNESVTGVANIDVVPVNDAPSVIGDPSNTAFIKDEYKLGSYYEMFNFNTFDPATLDAQEQNDKITQLDLVVVATDKNGQEGVPFVSGEYIFYDVGGNGYLSHIRKIFISQDNVQHFIGGNADEKITLAVKSLEDGSKLVSVSSESGLSIDRIGYMIETVEDYRLIKTQGRNVKLIGIYDNGGDANEGVNKIDVTNNDYVLSVVLSEKNTPPTAVVNNNGGVFTWTEQLSATPTTESYGPSFNGLFSLVSVNSTDPIIGFTVTVDALPDGAHERLWLDGRLDPYQYKGSGKTLLRLVDGETATLTYGQGNFAQNVDYAVSVDENGSAKIKVTGFTDNSVLRDLIGSIAYHNTSVTPTETQRNIKLVGFQDSGGTLDGGNDTSELNVVSVVNVRGIDDSAPRLYADTHTVTGSNLSGAYQMASSGVRLFENSDAVIDSDDQRH